MGCLLGLPDTARLAEVPRSAPSVAPGLRSGEDWNTYPAIDERWVEKVAPGFRVGRGLEHRSAGGKAETTDVAPGLWVG